MTRERHPPAERARPGRAPPPVPAAREPAIWRPSTLIALQRTAGNVAVCRMLARAPKERDVVTDANQHVIALPFTIGTEIGLALATKAQQLAPGGIDDAKLRQLRAVALVDATIGDDERLFLAALLDPANAATLAATRIGPGIKLTFSRASIEQHIAHVRELDKATLDPAITAEQRKAAEAGASGVHEALAEVAIHKQMFTLVRDPKWAAKLAAAIDFAPATVAHQAILEAMLNAASDGTEDDRALAAIVYVVAAAAGHPMAGEIHAGRVHVDAVPDTLFKKSVHALYQARVGRLTKGDTIYLRQSSTIDDVATRTAIVHELTHAGQDAEAPGKARPIALDRAELEAYLAGARYQLAQVAGLDDDDELAMCKQIAAAQSNPSFQALILANRRQASMYTRIVKLINSSSAKPMSDAILDRLLDPAQTTDGVLEYNTLQTIRAPGSYDIEDAQGNERPGANTANFDGLKGESVLDRLDRP